MLWTTVALPLVRTCLLRPSVVRRVDARSVEGDASVFVAIAPVDFVEPRASWPNRVRRRVFDREQWPGPALRRYHTVPMSARPIRTETGFADDARVRGLVEVCHPPRREALPRTTGDRSTVKAGQSIDGEGCLVHVIDQEPIDPVLDDLWKRTRAAADDGRARARDSIATRPNGSGQAPSISVAADERSRSSRSGPVTSPMNSAMSAATAG